jgi:hypothetical protein
MTMGALPTIPPLGTLAPLTANTAQASAGGDKCQFFSQTPADNSTVKTGQVFNVIWKIKNAGTTTWGPGYLWRFYSARNKLGTSQNSYDMTATTAPNGIADITVVATAPSAAGTVDGTWVLTNPQGVNFCNFDITVNVSASAAVVETAKPPAELSSTTVPITWGGGGLIGTASFTGSKRIEFIRVYYTPKGADADGTLQLTLEVKNSAGTVASKNALKSGDAKTYIDINDHQHVGDEKYDVTITRTDAGVILYDDALVFYYY